MLRKSWFLDSTASIFIDIFIKENGNFKYIFLYSVNSILLGLLIIEDHAMVSVYGFSYTTKKTFLYHSQMLFVKSYNIITMFYELSSRLYESTCSIGQVQCMVVKRI